jgi:hypothetical protein
MTVDGGTLPVRLTPRLYAAVRAMQAIHGVKGPARGFVTCARRARNAHHAPALRKPGAPTRRYTSLVSAASRSLPLGEPQPVTAS